MSVPLLAVGPDPLVLEELVASVVPRTPEAVEGVGGVATFLGLVRNHNHGRRVQYLEYEAYEPLALRVFAQISAEAHERWPGTRLGLHHRTGRLEVGEVCVAIVAASAHRADAFAVCRYAIERLKQIAPIWKHEFFEGGHSWIEGAASGSEDEQARAVAERTACA
jgi:molybdopterin synthase catalytic subunit